MKGNSAHKQELEKFCLLVLQASLKLTICSQHGWKQFLQAATMISYTQKRLKSLSSSLWKAKEVIFFFFLISRSRENWTKHHQTHASTVQDTTNPPIKLTTAKDNFKVTNITYMNTSKRKSWKAIQIENSNLKI